MKRVGLLSVVSLLSIIIILTLSLTSLSVMKENFNDVIDKDTTKSILSKDIKTNLIEMHRSEKNIILALTQKDIELYHLNFLQAQKEIENNIGSLRILIDVKNRVKLEAINTLYNKYVSAYEEIYQLQVLNSNQRVKELLRTDARDKLKLVNTLTDELALIINKEMIEEVAKQQTDIQLIKSKLQELTFISTIESAILKSVRDTGRAILLLTEDDIKQMATRSNQNLAKAQSVANKLRGITDKDKNTIIDNILRALDAYNIVQSKILTLTMQTTHQKAIEISTKNSKEYIAKARELISEIVRYNRTKSFQARALSDVRYSDSFNALLIVSSIITMILFYFVFMIYNYLNEKLTSIYKRIDIIKAGNFVDDSDSDSDSDELSQIGLSLHEAIKLLRENSITAKNEKWIKEGINVLSNQLITQTDPMEVSRISIDYLCSYLHAGIGSLYVFDENEDVLKQYANYAFVQREDIPNRFKLGEGTVGQVALQQSPIQLKNIQRTQLIIDTGTTSEPPLNTYTFPLLYKNELYGVIEVGSSELFDAKAASFFVLSNEVIATALYLAKQTEKVAILLENTELKSKELQKVNTQIAAQQQQLEETNAQMEQQQQELKETNAQMEEQQQELKEKNLTLEESQVTLDKRAEALSISGQYKSEFLANMSHELRTPLNSIILLSDMLLEDKLGHLDKEEIKKTSIINHSGNELLRLINDVLDLSKIEAGQMDIIVDSFESSAFNEEMATQFQPQAEAINLKFTTSDSYKETIYSDKERLAQIVRNLISNALKFTTNGTISLDITPAGNECINISVSDTGIGISDNKLTSIFEAFQQADGGTSRKYGGTGLGLSISKELTGMLGGELSVKSKIKEGSTFTIIIPNMQSKQSNTFTLKKSENINDDRDIITTLDKVFLIIEDDKDFAETLKEILNNKNEYALIAYNAEDGLKLAQEYDVKGVLLDLGLPDMNGIDVLKAFKITPNLRKIPVYVISGKGQEKQTAEYGAIGYSYKPMAKKDVFNVIDKMNTFYEKKMKDLLIVEDDEIQREALVEFIGNGSVKSTGVSSKTQAVQELDKGMYDGIIIDLGLKDGTGYEICEYIKDNNLNVPIIIYTGKDLSADEEQNLRQYTDKIVIKTVASHQRLLEEVDIFMHRVNIQHRGKRHNIMDIDLSGTKILVADDDIRNIYVLSEALGAKGAEIITANNGKQAVEKLDANSDIDLILMDIMMPIMDGYEAATIIKNNAKTKDIPIIAITAKAMKEDRQKALDAGCDDYMSKPLNIDLLLSIVKSWIR